MDAEPPRRVLRQVALIGIGAGDPRQLTAEAAEAIRATDVFLLLGKSSAAELADARRSIIEQLASGRHRVVTVPDPTREQDGSYLDGVAEWHAARAERLEAALVEQVQDGEQVGLLVWGDPAWFDSSIRLIEQVDLRGRVELRWSVVAGLGSMQLLAARHRLVLNRVGSAVLVTTGRRLAADGVPAGVDDVVVFLDGETAFTTLVGAGWDLYWGAYLGMEGELLVSGPVDEVTDRVVELRERARAERGWIFDIYLLRRRLG